MEKAMNTIISTAARRTFVSSLAALVLATALPQASFASDTEVGLWKVNTALSKFHSRSSSLVIERATATDGTGGSFVVISNGKAYLATPAADASSGGVKAAQYGAWKGMKLTQIGIGVRAINKCAPVCQFGQVSDRLTVTFRNVGAGGQPMGNLLALDR
jgi:hypothetical protein